jgi:hypothetical protein
LREESCGRKANRVERVPDGDDKWIWMSPRLTAAKLIRAWKGKRFEKKRREDIQVIHAKILKKKITFSISLVPVSVP